MNGSQRPLPISSPSLYSLSGFQAFHFYHLSSKVLNFLTKRGAQLNQQPPSRAPTVVPSLQTAQQMELHARIGSLETQLAKECARRLELELVEEKLRQVLNVSEKENVSLLVSVRKSDEKRRQLVARLEAISLEHGEPGAKSSANTVRGIFNKVRSEAQRLSLLIFSIFSVCAVYFSANLGVQILGLSRMGCVISQPESLTRRSVSILQ